MIFFSKWTPYSLVRSRLAKFAAPHQIIFVNGLPKTRSGKIMRRILRKISNNQHDQIGDVTTLADPAVVDHLIERGVFYWNFSGKLVIDSSNLINVF